MFNSGIKGRRARDGEGALNPQTRFVQNNSPLVSLTSWSAQGSSELALSTAGGETVLINGVNFVTGMTVLVNGQVVSPYSLISSSQISFTSPALSGGNYSVVVYSGSKIGRAHV